MKLQLFPIAVSLVDLRIAKLKEMTEKLSSPTPTKGNISNRKEDGAKTRMYAGFLSLVQTLVVDGSAVDGRDAGREAVRRAAQNAPGARRESVPRKSYQRAIVPMPLLYSHASNLGKAKRRPP